MGRIKKTASERHEASLSPYITDFIKQTVDLPLHKLPQHITTFPVNWPIPRGDLYHWIPTLNRFDHILELFIKEYALDQGPQTQPFAVRLLARGDGEEASTAEVDLAAFSDEGDRELVETILQFTRLLLERCGNRSLYASSSHLNCLLNTVSLTLLKVTLRVTLRLGQRYHTSRQRMASHHAMNIALAGHYAITLDNVQKIASPFQRNVSATLLSTTTPSKGKSRTSEDGEPHISTADIAGIVKARDVPPQFKQELAGVRMIYYEQTAPSTVEVRAGTLSAAPLEPTTPTPVRRRSNLGPGSASRQNANEEIADTPAKSVETPDRPILGEANAPNGPKTFEISPLELSQKPAWQVIKDHITDLPKEYQFDLLHRVRVAKAFVSSKTCVNDLVAVRLLAIANLAYVYSESQFLQKIAQPDSEEPRQRQLAQQLTDLLQPPSDAQQEISKEMIVIVIMALEALTKTKSKSTEVTQALNISVSHGVLFYVLRKVQATLAEDNLPFEEYDWCRDMFDLVQSLAQPASHQQRNADAMVSAGFIGILVDILTLRTKPAQVYFPSALHLIDAFVNNGVKDAFTSLVSAKGLDVLADLTSEEVQHSLQAVERGDCFPTRYRAQTTNYQIPFIDQQILRQLLKFIAHMYANSIGNSDRLLRNLIDSPQLLGALKTVISHAEFFGSNVWSGAINILSSFIHNEPTSYQVIAEAGLSKMFLEAITRRPITVTDVTAETTSGETAQEPMDTSSTPVDIMQTQESSEEGAIAEGILPVGETMRDIPPVFGAICLNENGFRMFEACDALEKFLKIFESPNHVKAMEEEHDVAGYIGQSFNELVRHHDQLRDRVATATLSMVKRVVKLCEDRARYKGVGAKLWIDTADSDKAYVVGGRQSLAGIPLGAMQSLDIESKSVDYKSSEAALTESPISESELENDDLINGRTGGRSTSDFISVLCRFLAGYLSHSKTYTPFIEQGGAELLLDLALAPCNPYNFHELSTSEELSRVIQIVATEKPHLIVPSLVKRTQLALRHIIPFITHHPRDRAFFRHFTVPGSRSEPGIEDEVMGDNGTLTVKIMVSVQVLVGILTDVCSPQNIYENRHRPLNLLSQVNLTDHYAELIDSLAELHSACIREEIMMQNNMPKEWRDETRVKGMGYDNTEANKVMGMDINREVPGHAPSSNEQSDGGSSAAVEATKESDKKAMRSRAEFRNTQILTYLLSQIPSGIDAFFQALGKSLLSKPRTSVNVDAWQKQNAFTLAEHLAGACVDQLNEYRQDESQQLDRLAYDIVILCSLSKMLIDKRTSGPGLQSGEIMTVILKKFVDKGGLVALGTRLITYRNLIQEHKDASTGKTMDDDLSSSERVAALALAATNLILEIFSKITKKDNLGNSAQSATLAEPHRDRSDFFQVPQFIIELRHTILPTVMEVWSSPVMLILPTSTVKDVIDLLRLNLDIDADPHAIRRNENATKKVATEKRRFRMRREYIVALMNEGFDQMLAIEALYRCNNNLNFSRDYCNFRTKMQAKGDVIVFTFPVPEGELDEQSSRAAQPIPGISATQRELPSSPTRVPSVDMPDADEAQTARQENGNADNSVFADLGQGNQRELPADMIGAGIAQVLSQALGRGAETLGRLPIQTHGRSSANEDQARPAEVETLEKYVTMEDLEDKRAVLREGLVDRCLDILNTHSDVTFELSDLISYAALTTGGSKEAVVARVEISQTILNSLISLQPSDDVEPEGTEGTRIASYAHLLALIVSQHDFFDAAQESLRDNFDTLKGFIRIGPSHKPEEASPWIGNILAVMELVLAEDERPRPIVWDVPDYTQPYEETPIVELHAPIVPMEKKSELFDTLMVLLPKIGKDIVLAVAVVRVLIFLTRRRSLAQKLSQKQHMVRLFSMMKQLVVTSNGRLERLQVDFMVLLRHIMEDDETIRQTMRTEIQSLFENRPSTRPLDTTTYLRSLAPIALRSPELFVEVTNEKVKLAKWEPTRGGQALTLKTVEREQEPAQAADTADHGAPGGTSVGEPERPAFERMKTSDLKAPVVDNPDGVVQFLLGELSKYKDVADKEPADEQASAAAIPADPASGDVDMAEATPTSGSPSEDTPPADSAAQGIVQQQTPKPAEKSKHVIRDQHPIYTYRCFILASLTELLASYNRCKVEFINYSRKAEYQISTPSKPRSGLLNYLLYNLVPTGSLGHATDVPAQKRTTVSFWAVSVLVSLTAKTNEKTISFSPSANGDEEPDLIYVRKFVLEHALRAYKDATVSAEPLDQKYARLLSLSELFNRMLTGKPVGGTNAFYMDMLIASQKHLGRLMYEKNFILALTASIAEIDLNFPGAKRAIKYILRPLKWLTDIGVTLSTSSDYSSSGPSTTEEDEISSATSISDDDQEREETPDLFRNSTLAMYEPDNEDDDEDEDEDEEEDYYGEEYEEEMDYEEDQGPEVHEGDVVSDEDDEDIDGMGEIEGLSGDVPMELELEIDDDDESGDDEDEDDSDMDDDDDDDDDDGEEIEIIDELNGDDENGSMIEDEDEDEEGWEDDAGEEYDGQDHLDHVGSPHGGPLEHMVRILDGDDRSDIMDNFDGDDAPAHLVEMGGDQYFEDEMMGDEDDDQDEEDYDEEDVVYEPEPEGEFVASMGDRPALLQLQEVQTRLFNFEQQLRRQQLDMESRLRDGADDDADNEGMGWGWDDAMPPGAIMRNHPHLHGHRGPFAVAIGGDDLFPPSRSHGGRFATAPGQGNGTEEATNPLLQRTGRGGATNRARQDSMSDWMYDNAPPGFGQRGTRDGLSFVSDLIQMVGPQGGARRISVVDRAGGGLNFMPHIFHITGGPGRLPGTIRPPTFSRFASFFGGRGGAGRSEPGMPSQSSSDPSGTILFTPAMTHERWKDECKVIFGPTHVDKALKLVNAIMRLLVPPAQEAKRQRDKEDAERRAAVEKAKEEARKKEEAERLEREEREKREEEERQAREREEAEAAAADRAKRGEPEPAAEGMEGVEGESTEQPEVPAEERVMITIRGRELDITHLGIDREYLDALPEDMREEVIMQVFAEQRSQEAEAGEPSSEISREFLDALPAEIQQELLRSEAADRRRRERDENRRRAAANGAAAPAGPGEMDTADFFATLPAGLRQNILLEADDDMLANIPEEFASEARAILGDRRQRREAHTGRLPHREDPAAIGSVPAAAAQEHRARRPVAQMLDKSGVATLLRLMFVALQSSARNSMHGVLSDICKNTQNRAEVISVLLQILQDGSADANALEKSFTQLNFRAKQIASADKTPKPLLRRALSGQQVSPPNADISPLMIVQQCLSTLTALSHDNPRVSSFFLSEHETSISQRLKQSKKGKAKESKASKYPLNALLTLLDRKTIIENSAVMEHLASLLIKVTEPLKILLKRAKEAEKENEKKATSSIGTQTAEAADVNMVEGETASTENGESKPSQTEDKGDDKKKHRELTPPEVPEENLRLVVNIIAARECNSKTFQSTLEIINHLSAIPGAKNTFGRELVHRAQDLGEAVLQDLQQLHPQIQNAKTGTDVQGAALANFSPASSHQTKLLRVLLALDYLFDPKHAGTLDRPLSAGEALAPQAREDLLSTLYETSTFVNLWTNLSNCLTAIRQRGNMSNVATILQPLIESFMVVCKNTTTKEAPHINMAASQELTFGTPPAESRIESLFFSFTEDHRKILNDLVRNNPKLLNGTFDVLAKNSKVLEFDNKRNYFSRRLHDRRAEERVPHATIQLSIRRNQIFMDSFKNLYYKSANEIKYGKLNIRFSGEEGVDAGGVTREWFAALSRQMFNPDYALFNPVAADRTTFHPNPMSDINPEHLLFFKFIGRIIGKALYEGRVLDCHFSRAVYKRILGKPVNLKDMETLDLDYYKSLCWILENDITDVTFETFSLEVDKFGETEIIDLIPDGRNIPVTEENKNEYVRCVVEQRLTKSVSAQLENFLVGFHEIIPTELISIFSEQELELLISGLPDIDVDDWKNNTEYHNYQPTSPQIQWFWRAVRSFDKEEKAKLLQFVTGTSKVPLNGFKELEGMNGFSRFNIHRDFGNKERLPSSHTCFNQLDLPEYDSYEHLRQAMYTAMTQGSEYFGFA